MSTADSLLKGFLLQLDIDDALLVMHNHHVLRMEPMAVTKEPLAAQLLCLSSKAQTTWQ